jgi:uncharacterized MnhB-related membrane protein
MKTLANWYFNAPKFWDLVIGTIVSAFGFFLRNKFGIDTKDIISVQSNLASTAISLAGFILTALTIIVTLRANLAYKGLEESNSGLELIFNSKAYKSIVNVFKGAILELVIVALFLYATMLISKPDSYEPYILSTSYGVLISIAFTVLRCLYVLFNLVELEIKARENAENPMPKPHRWRVTLNPTDNIELKNQIIPNNFTVEMVEEEVEEVFKPFE